MSGEKLSIGAKNYLYPFPVTIIGTNIKGKPNFITIAHVGIWGYECIALCMNKIHYSCAGIRKNKAFSVNIPSPKIIDKVDCCGLVSGNDTDKSSLFTIFYGNLGSVPMIVECPINMECKLVKTIIFSKYYIFVGKIGETYCDSDCISGNKADFTKVQPVLFTMPDKGYWQLGPRFASAWDTGKEVKRHLIKETRKY